MRRSRSDLKTTKRAHRAPRSNSKMILTDTNPAIFKRMIEFKDKRVKANGSNITYLCDWPIHCLGVSYLL
jgi:hypothetical protein